MLQFGDDKKGIFEGQVLIVEDDELSELVIELITKENYSAAYSIYLAFENLVKSVEDYKDPYLKERASDYKDIRNRLISIILGQVTDFSEINKNIILVTEELTPSDTMQFDLNYVKGFLTAVGGETSHAAILARTMGLPALVMTLLDIDELRDGDKIVIDAISSIVIKNPSTVELDLYESKILRQVEMEKELFSLKDKDAETKDGVKVFLKANIGTPVDITYVNKYGVEGIGLFRTEFLYMKSLQPPTEDEQFETYK
ncbi:phosphoenolpyruvate-protein phosphotransferase, partial [Borreliella bissettiae]